MITGCTQAADYIQMQPDCMLHDKREQLKKAAKTQKEEMIMASRSSNRAAVPEAKSALDKFKYEVAKDLTSKQNGSVGGYMVKKMIEQQEKQMAGK